MGGMEFTWKMTSVLVWPLVVLVLGVAFRDAVARAVSTLVGGLRRFRAAGVELDFAMKNAWDEVTEVLAEVPGPPYGEGEVPSSLVDLYPAAAKSPRRGIRMAYEQVRRALESRFPELADTTQSDLASAMRRLVDHGAMNPEVEEAVNQVSRVVSLFTETGNTEDIERRSFEFIGLTEGAIHAILRSESPHGSKRPTSTGGQPVTLQSITGTWSGNYVSSKGVTPIVFVASEVEGDGFHGEMRYPEDHLAQTRVTGQIVSNGEAGFLGPASQVNGVNVKWRELGYIRTGQAHLEFDGIYSATVFEDEIVGEWMQGDRLVGMIKMTRH